MAKSLNLRNNPGGTTRAIEWLLFAATFVSFAYFHSGGGWNQNVRFAQVRAIVERTSLSVDSFLIYQVDDVGSVAPRLRRIPVEKGGVNLSGRPYALAWFGAGLLRAVEGSATQVKVPLNSIAVSGDVTYAGGRFYPNKAPGTTLLAVPGYWLVQRLEDLVRADPDDWWTLTLNAWLTSLLSVGFLSALGCVLFFRVAAKLCPQSLTSALLATFAFAWSTIYFPYATMLFEHNVMAVALLGAFSALLVLREAQGGTWQQALRAGMCAGCAVLANYIGVVPAMLLALYGGYRLGLRQAAWFVAGIIPPLLVIGLYDLACFGSPFATSYSQENPGFQNTGLFLGVLGSPRLDVLFALLFSPYRGLFYGSPFLAVGVAGLIGLHGDRRWKAEAVLFDAILVFFLAFNAGFNGWDGGWATGPRYLLPALPFLALPAVSGFAKWRRTTCLLAAWSAVGMLLATSVDPQPPIGDRAIAFYPGRPLSRYDPLLDYHVRLFLEEKPPELASAGIEAMLDGYGTRLRAAGLSEPDEDRHVAEMRRALAALGGRMDPKLIPIAGIHGPVSANPTGMYEGGLFRLFPADSAVARWNSFNAGEFLRPESRSSLFPLLVLVCLLATASLVACRLAERRCE